MPVYQPEEYNKEIRVMATPADQEVQMQLSVSLVNRNIPWLQLAN